MTTWIIATIAAFFVKGLCGFANTLVFTSILSFKNANAGISPVDLLLGYPSNIIMAFKERKSIKWSFCLPLAALVLIGSIPGILFLKNTDVKVIKIIFGIVIVFLGIQMLLQEINHRSIKESKILTFIIGILAGILCGLYGVGALLGVYVSRISESSKDFKANICVVFLIENTMRIILYSVWGIITASVAKQMIVLIPFMLIGLGAGMLSTHILDEKLIKKIVILMLIISGFALILMNL